MKARNTEIAIRLDRVSRTFGLTSAVSDVSLEIRHGEIVSLVGQSGCGKSTLMRMIAGVENVDSGRLFLDGREVDGQAFVEPEARGVGFVFQDYALFPHLSVRDNIRFGLKALRKSEAAAIATDMIRRVGIEHLADRFPHTLSGGEQQRVALARALAPNPPIVLMDEPFSNLDQGLRERVRTETISLLRSLDTTVIMVTHDPQEALSSGDRVILMRRGEVVQMGSPHDLYDRPATAYAADFFCNFNKVSGIHRDGRIETPIGTYVPANGPAPSGDATLYVRPQAIKVSLETGDFLAQIEHRTFRGASEQIVLRVDGLDRPLVAITTDRLPHATDAVKVSIAPDGLLAF